MPRVDIGFDDHVSQYFLPIDKARELLKTCKTIDECSDFVVEHGEYLGQEGEVFLDTMDGDVEEFKKELEETL